jgi:hypothetical protein
MDSDIKFLNIKKNFNIIKKDNIYKYIFKIFKIFFFIILPILLIISLLFYNIKNRILLKDILNINLTLKNKFETLRNIPSLNSNEINDRIRLLKLITNNNELIYKGYENCLLNDPDNQLCIYHLIYPKKVVGKNRILIGEKSNGCYVLLDDFENITTAYSFGISNAIQFDDDLAKRGIDVYMYDHTINSLPYSNSKFHWKKIGISGINETNEQLKTLDYLMKENDHSSNNNMILKIDVEGWEWNALNDLNPDILNQFKYLIIEFHFTDPNNITLYYNVLKKIKKTHQVFYSRCHMREIAISFGNNIICKYLELSYIIREGHKFIKDDSIYPIFDFDFLGPQENGLEINLNLLKLFDFDN